MWTRLHYNWLEGELPELVRQGVLAEEAAQRLRSHYRLGQGPSLGGLALLVLAVAGSAFIGAGVILLIAHNWQELPRTVRTGLAFAPLLAAQALGFWTLVRRERSEAWRESSAILIAAGVCASIALVGQIYHIPGDLGVYLRTCGLLALPLAFLFQSSAAAAFSMIAFASWAAGTDSWAEASPWFWPAFALVTLPTARFWVRRDTPVRGTLLAWVFCACLTVGVLSILGSLPEEPFWGVVPPLLFLTLYLLARGAVAMPEASAFWVFSLGGLLIMAFMGTFMGYWEHLHSPPVWSEVTAHGWGVLAGSVIVCALALAYVARRLGWVSWLVAGLAGLVIASNVAGQLAAEQADWLPGTLAAVMNAYLFASGVALLTAGLRGAAFLETNAGLALIALLGVLRFFDAGLPFTLRGLLFVLIGAGFLAANGVLARRRKDREAAVS